MMTENNKTESYSEEKIKNKAKGGTIIHLFFLYFPPWF